MGPTRPERDPGRLYEPPPVTRWGWVVRWGFVALCALGLILTMVEAAAGADLGGRVLPRRLVFLLNPWRLVADVVLTVMATVAIFYRRRHPVLVLSLVGTAAIISEGASVYTAWAFVSLCTRRRWREVVYASALMVLTTVVGLFMPWGALGGENMSLQSSEVIAPLVFMVVWLAALAGYGFYVGARRDLVASLTERAERAEREQRLQIEAGKASERARIAREMHDVLAHRISLVSMHAGVLAYRNDLPPEKTKEIAGIIQENAHASLTELRQVLTTLREPGELGESVAKPQPTLADVPTLLREAEIGGMHVTFRNELEHPDELPAPVARHIFRMVQEGLTNARKHAQGAPITVTLLGRPGKGVTLEVRNPLTGDTGVPGAKLGLVGLAERAEMLGGTFEYRSQHGDFVMEVWLPWQK